MMIQNISLSHYIGMGNISIRVFTDGNQSRIGNIPIRILSGSLMGINLLLGIFPLEYSQWLTDGNQSQIGNIPIRILTVAH